jgi:hypothetical protein
MQQMAPLDHRTLQHWVVAEQQEDEGLDHVSKILFGCLALVRNGQTESCIAPEVPQVQSLSMPG